MDVIETLCGALKWEMVQCDFSVQTAWKISSDEMNRSAILTCSIESLLLHTFMQTSQ